MKYKIIDGSTFILAGVASYSNREDSNNPHVKEANQDDPSKKKAKSVRMSFNFDLPNFTFDIDKEALKRDIDRAKEEARKFKEAAQSSENPFDPGMDEFSKYMNEFGKQMNVFGNTVGEYGKTLGKSMESWAKNFDTTFARDWVDSMESTFKNIFGEDSSRHETKADDELNHHWSGNYTSEDYSLWQLESLFNELYENSEVLKQVDLSPDLYYEVLCHDLQTKMNDQLSFIGCQVKSTKDLPFTVVTQRLTAENWLVVKLSQEEYEKDWMLKIETLDILSNYTIDSYFAIRHFKKQEQQAQSPYKLYIPLKKVR